MLTTISSLVLFLTSTNAPARPNSGTLFMVWLRRLQITTVMTSPAESTPRIDLPETSKASSLATLCRSGMGEFLNLGLRCLKTLGFPRI